MQTPFQAQHRTQTNFSSRENPNAVTTFAAKMFEAIKCFDMYLMFSAEWIHLVFNPKMEHISRNAH